MAQDKLSALSGSVMCINGGIDGMANNNTIQFNQSTSNVISLERQVRIATGALTLTGILLGVFVHSSAYSLAAFVGAGLIFAGISDWCGMGLLIAKMPWNNVPSCQQ
jgi:predicted branched-subunit amino acid permease